MSELALSVPEAARELGISKKHAYELVRRGELPGAKQLGRRIVISRPAFEESLGKNGHSKPSFPYKPDVPTTYLPYANEVHQMLGSDTCPEGSHKLHCPYCGICDRRGHDPFQLCRGCWGTFSLPAGLDTATGKRR